MFDYVVNRFNMEPLYVIGEERDRRFLYAKYTEAPFLDLPRNLVEFKTLHKKKFWYNIRRNRKLYEASFGQLNFKIVVETERLGRYLSQVYHLFNERWQNEYTSASWKTIEGFDAYRHAIIDLASSGEVFLAVLTDKNDQLLSYGLCLNNNRVIHLYQHTTIMNWRYRKYSLGKILMMELLSYAIVENYRRFDFMGGTSSYKYEWCIEKHDIYRLIGKRSLANYVKLAYFRVRYYLQFNAYTRKFLKLIFTRWERFVVGRQTNN